MYSVKAHSDGYTVRQEGSGDILTFPLRAYLSHQTARDEAHAVARELNRAYDRGYKRGVDDTIASLEDKGKL
jgi:hypothetical protein